MTKYQIVKTDGRHAANERFQYYVQMQYSVNYAERLRSFLELRDYCVQIWGNSCERDYYIKAANAPGVDWLNKHWCWHTADGIWRLYFATESDINWFNLKWQ